MALKRLWINHFALRKISKQILRTGRLWKGEIDPACNNDKSIQLWNRALELLLSFWYYVVVTFLRFSNASLFSATAWYCKYASSLSAKWGGYNDTNGTSTYKLSGGWFPIFVDAKWYGPSHNLEDHIFKYTRWVENMFRNFLWIITPSALSSI